MKRIYTILSLLLVLVSCSEWKYTHGIKSKKSDFHASKPASAIAEEERTTVSKDQPAMENFQPSAAPEEMSEAIPEETAIQPVDEDEEEITILVREDEDTLEAVSPEVLKMAFDAEDQGRKSRNLGLIGVLLTLTYILAFVGLIFAIIGLVKGIHSLKSRYNTPKGVNMARTGVITSAIVIGLYVIAIILVVTLLLLLL